MRRRAPYCSANLSLIVFCALSSLRAENLAVDFDVTRTKINFVLSDVLHTVHGDFRLKDGHISFDPASCTMAGDLVVDAASGMSGSAARDRRMTRDILEAQRFPEIRLKPTSCVGSIASRGNSAVAITGSFFIHGQAHPLTIPIQIQMSETDVIVTGKFTIPYVAWGMKNPSNFLIKVSDKVEIDLTAFGHIQPAKTSAQ